MGIEVVMERQIRNSPMTVKEMDKFGQNRHKRPREKILASGKLRLCLFPGSGWTRGRKKRQGNAEIKKKFNIDGIVI